MGFLSAESAADPRSGPESTRRVIIDRLDGPPLEGVELAALSEETVQLRDRTTLRAADLRGIEFVSPAGARPEELPESAAPSAGAAGSEDSPPERGASPSNPGGTSSNTAAPAPHSRPNLRIMIRGGGEFLADDVRVEDDGLTVSRGNGGPLRIALGEVGGVWFDANRAPPDDFLAPRDTDRLLLLTDGSMTRLDGFLESLSPTEAAFEWRGELQRAPRDLLCGVAFARDVGSDPEPRWTVHFLQGDRLPARGLAWTAADVAKGAGPADENSAGMLRVILPRGQSMELDISDVQRIESHSPRVLRLSAQPPVETRSLPLIAAPRPVAIDRSVQGGRLQAGGREFPHGFGMQAGSLIAFDLDSDRLQFRAIVDLEPATAPDGDCECVVRGDGRELVREQLVRGAGPRILRADLAGVRRLELAVEYGGDLDFGDQVHWCDVQLIRPPAP